MTVIPVVMSLLTCFVVAMADGAIPPETIREFFASIPMFYLGWGSAFLLTVVWVSVEHIVRPDREFQRIAAAGRRDRNICRQRAEKGK